MVDGYGFIGYIFYWLLFKFVNFDGNFIDCDKSIELVVYSDKSKLGRFEVRFVFVEGFGYFGYIEYVFSGKIVYFCGGSLDLKKNIGLVYYFDCYVGVFFVFDEENEYIVYWGGKIWYFWRSLFNFDDDMWCVFSFDVYDVVKFYFGKLDGILMFLYLILNFSGIWKVIKVFINLVVFFEF